MHQKDLNQGDAGGGSGLRHGLKRHDLSHQAAGSHAGAGGIVGHPQKTGGNGAQDDARQNGGKPDDGSADDVWHLQHGGSQSLGDETAKAVFAERGRCEPDHIGGTAHCRRSGRNSA